VGAAEAGAEAEEVVGSEIGKGGEGRCNPVPPPPDSSGNPGSYRIMASRTALNSVPSFHPGQASE
jgi:hypothetical protein